MGGVKGKSGRKQINPEVKRVKILLAVPVPVLDLVRSTGNVTEFFNEAALEKLARRRYTK